MAPSAPCDTPKVMRSNVRPLTRRAWALVALLVLVLVVVGVWRLVAWHLGQADIVIVTIVTKEVPPEVNYGVGPLAYCETDLASEDPRHQAGFMAWRAGGSEVLFNVGSDLYAVEGNGQWLRKLAEAGQAPALSISPNGKSALYASCQALDEDRDRFSEPELMLADLSQPHASPRRLTTNRVLDYYPVWSPDGERVAFLRGARNATVRDEGPAGGLFVMRRDGSDVRPVSGGEALLGPPRWSPDGRWIAFVNDDGDKAPGLYIMDAGLNASQRLTDTLSWPAWSPDSQRLAFVRRDGSSMALYTIAATAADPDEQQIAAMPNDPQRAWIRQLAWSPTGSHILYACQNSALCVVALDGTPVGTLPTYGEGAAWSPDGSRIAVAISDPDQIRASGIVAYTTAPDGTDPQPLVREYEWDRRAFFAAQAEHEDVATGIEACTKGVVIPDPAQHPGLVRDCQTLIGLRRDLLGPVALNWNSETPIREWIGVFWDGTPPRVVRLELRSLGLPGKAGPLPAAIGELAELEVLILYDNQFAGLLPAELGRLQRLQRLHLFDNAFTGGIPPELGQLTNLRSLALGDNHLTGQIPESLAQLTKLTTLDLSSNRLTGVIPPKLGRLIDLRDLDLGANQLTGEIPQSVAELTNLRTLDLSSNQLTGTIPRDFRHLTRLAKLYLSGNQLTGCTPPAWASLGANSTDLDRLDLPSCAAA